MQAASSLAPHPDREIVKGRGMSRKKPEDLRDPDKKPDRLLRKEDGLRQVIHAAIRMTLGSEDAYGTHLLIRSAETVLSDLHKRKGMPDLFDLMSYVDPEFRPSLHAIHNETYNFLKHGHLSHDGEVPIHSIVLSNDVTLWMVSARFRNLFGYGTYHMSLYERLLQVIHPNFLKWNSQSQIEEFITLRKRAEHLSRGELLGAAEFASRSDRQFQTEKEEDLIDVKKANETIMKKFEVTDLKQS